MCALIIPMRRKDQCCGAPRVCVAAMYGEEAPVVTLSVTKNLITSDLTHHHCTRFDPDAGWFCTWMPDRRLLPDQAKAAIELAEIVAKGRDGGPDTTNYAYFTWQRVKELSEVLGVIPLKTVLYLESLE